MKKVIALALAMILTTGLSSVAMAATVDAVLVESLKIRKDSAIYAEDKNGDIVAVKKDDNTEATSLQDAIVQPGKTVYIPIVYTETTTG